LIDYLIVAKTSPGERIKRGTSKGLFPVGGVETFHPSDDASHEYEAKEGD
jgi:hypothetical protein